MDFSFYVAFRRDSGVRLFDIRYRGERIVYELGLGVWFMETRLFIMLKSPRYLDEALAHYAGNDPVQSGTAYLDTVSFIYFPAKPISFILDFAVLWFRFVPTNKLMCSISEALAI